MRIDERANPLEMSLPFLAARIEKHNNAASFRIAPAEIARTGEIAMITRPSQVRRLVVSTMFLWQKVLDVKAIEREILLMKPAVFAALPGTRSNQPPCGGNHAGWPRRARRILALA